MQNEGGRGARERAVAESAERLERGDRLFLAVFESCVGHLDWLGDLQNCRFTNFLALNIGED